MLVHLWTCTRGHMCVLCVPITSVHILACLSAKFQEVVSWQFVTLYVRAEGQKKTFEVSGSVFFHAQTLKNSSPCRKPTAKKQSQPFPSETETPIWIVESCFSKKPEFLPSKIHPFFFWLCFVVLLKYPKHFKMAITYLLMRCHLQGYLGCGCQCTLRLFCLKLAKLIRHVQLPWIICHIRHALHAIAASKTNTQHGQKRFQTDIKNDRTEVTWSDICFEFVAHVSNFRTMCGESEPRLDHPAHGSARFCEIWWRELERTLSWCENTKDSDGEGSLFGSQDDKPTCMSCMSCTSCTFISEKHWKTCISSAVGTTLTRLQKDMFILMLKSWVQVEAYAQEANLSDEDFGEVPIEFSQCLGVSQLLQVLSWTSQSDWIGWIAQVLSPFGPETFKSAVDCWVRSTVHRFVVWMIECGISRGACRDRAWFFTAAVEEVTHWHNLNATSHGFGNASLNACQLLWEWFYVSIFNVLNLQICIINCVCFWRIHTKVKVAVDNKHMASACFRTLGAGDLGGMESGPADSAYLHWWFGFDRIWPLLRCGPTIIEYGSSIILGRCAEVQLFVDVMMWHDVTWCDMELERNSLHWMTSR